MTETFHLSSAAGGGYEMGENVGYLVARVTSTLMNLVTQRTQAELDITATQGRTLYMVASGRCVLAVELAREFGIDASAVTRLIDRLAQRKLLTRERSTADRRVVWLAVTPEGQDIAAQMPVIFNEVLDRLLSGFTPEEVGFLKNMLRRLLVNHADFIEKNHVTATNFDRKS
ncbi:MarR family transcriptional regulator [Paraburkholderia sediminicola]|uniref:MarR family winged helix-turn-helix transcriptional regulator n=1 Tax=Paraburkholderia sediminicola TaxID=458836 RepID=UPI0038B9C444